MLCYCHYGEYRFSIIIIIIIIIVIARVETVRAISKDGIDFLRDLEGGVSHKAHMITVRAPYSFSDSPLIQRYNAVALLGTFTEDEM